MNRLDKAVLARPATAVSEMRGKKAARAAPDIPVVGHLGMVPRHVTWTGYRAIGRTVEEALELAEDRVLRQVVLGGEVGHPVVDG